MSNENRERLENLFATLVVVFQVVSRVSISYPSSHHQFNRDHLPGLEG